MSLALDPSDVNGYVPLVPPVKQTQLMPSHSYTYIIKTGIRLQFFSGRYISCGEILQPMNVRNSKGSKMRYMSYPFCKYLPHTNPTQHSII
jgi:hypothetical protein